MDNYLIENVELENIDFDHVNDDLPRYGEGFDYNGEKSNWCVYVHINKINGKMYIGISSNLKDRWYSKGKKYIGCDAIYNAFQKYGWDNFRHIVIMNGLTSKMADSIEIYLIEKYHTHAETGDGYNIARGGLGGSLFKSGENHPCSIPVHQYDLNGIYIQSFDCISDANELLSSSIDRHNGTISEVLQADTNHFAYGYLWSYDLVDQMEPFYPVDSRYIDEYHKPTVDGGYGRIVQLTIDGVLVKIHRNIYHITCDNNSKWQILKCCKREKIMWSYKNSIWLFESDYNEDNVADIIHHNNIVKKRNHCIQIDMYDLDGNYIDTFDSIKDIATTYSLDPSTISKVCRGEKNKCGNYQFRYHGEQPPEKYLAKRIIKNPRKIKYKLAQIDPTTNSVINIYLSYSDIKTTLGRKNITASNIKSCADGKALTAYGYIWKYVDNDKEE